MSAPAIPVRSQAPALAMFLTLLTGATFIGFSGVFVRLADVGPAAAGFWRMIFALPVLAAWTAMERRRPATTGTGRGGLVAIALAGLTFGIDVVLYNASLAHTTLANASLLGNLAPIGVVLGGWLLLGDKPSRRILGALMLAIAGAALLVLPKFTGSAARGSLFGDGLAFGAAMSYAAYILAVGRARAHADAGRVSLISSLICAAFCLVAALGLGEQMMPGSLQGWLAVIALGLVSHALGQGLITLSLGSYGAGAASLVMVWPALVSVLAAWAIFGEQPTPVQAFGGVAILAAVLLVRKG
ncbi:DMT family transporter [Bosea sp. TND4EK4]|uniref:DMT family transporter n=1 Tax=Bosea sp. TND4EK4 TaxID=1907408 RepID=UPI000954106D|nr:DMT family transporter [Bosea sp. TND4EK4]SIR32578.1 EamA domain-containing membrane protein RarD [Bosea sp. TND4EK4]